MPDYILRGAERVEDGSIAEPLIEETVTAAGPREAIKLAIARDLTARNLKTNVLWMTDASGRVIWSLRLADMTWAGRARA